MSLNRLHAEENRSLTRPVPDSKQTESLDRVQQQRAHGILRPQPNAQQARAAVGEHRGEQTHRVRTFWIPHDLNVRMFVDVDAGADCDALRQILSTPGHARADDRFRVRAYMFAQSITDARQRAVVLEPKEQLHRRSEEHTSELQSLRHLVCRLLLEKKKN